MKKTILIVLAILGVAGVMYLENEMHYHEDGHEHKAEAHSGRTDRYGGHHDRKRGGYHYHHGCPPHQHSNGCKYNYKNCRR